MSSRTKVGWHFSISGLAECARVAHDIQQTHLCLCEVKWWLCTVNNKQLSVAV